MLKILLTAALAPGKRIVKYYREGMTGLNDPLFNFAYSPRFMMAFSAKSVKFPAKISCPVLLAVGENDEIFSQESTKALLDEIPASDKTMLVIPGAKHVEYPEGSLVQVQEWLNTHYSG